MMKQKENNAIDPEWEMRYQKMEADALPDNVTDLIHKQWMLVTAGNKDSFNPMTASWGAMGCMWERPSLFIVIRNSRYTYRLLQQEESFTISFFPEQYRPALRICGTKSGRDTDKVTETGLSPLTTPSGLISFAEARMIMECKSQLNVLISLPSLITPLSFPSALHVQKSPLSASPKNDPATHSLFQ